MKKILWKNIDKIQKHSRNRSHYVILEKKQKFTVKKYKEKLWEYGRNWYKYLSEEEKRQKKSMEDIDIKKF